jgi:molybdate transport system substrate-binding protein
MRDRVLDLFAVCLLQAMVLAASGLAAVAAELKVMAPNAVKEAVSEIALRFERETKHKLLLSWAGSEAILKRVSEGEVFDVVISTSTGVERMAKAGKLSAGSKRDFSKSAVAVAVKAGVPRPDVSTVEGLRQALLKAQSIAISSGASGRYLEQLFQKLGVSEQIRHKIIQPPSGAQISDLLARGEAELGFQQVTELVHAKGFQYLGPLPAEIQNFTTWSAAVHTGSNEAEAAGAFISAVASPQSASAIRATGMEPVP